MTRKALIQVRRGLERDIGFLAEGELGYCTDTEKLYIGTKAGNVLLVAAQTVGDMLKSIYDTNNDGIVDRATVAESVEWASVKGKPSAFTPSIHSHGWTEITGKPSTFAPSGHTHTKSQITDFPTSMPANGGNADTVGGKQASDFSLSAHDHDNSYMIKGPVTWNDLKGV